MISDCRFNALHNGSENPFLVAIYTPKSEILYTRPPMPYLKSSIERLASLGEVEHDPDARRAFLEFRDQLTQGKIRAAEKQDGRWTVTPGGASVRTGAYVAPSVICMPPMFINVGAYVDEGTMIDSHALVGSCAQIGKRVHLSAAAQIGGVLEPINAAPVIIEDDVLVGGNCGVYEGTLVRARAVLGAGTILTRSTPLFDLVNGEILRAAGELPLIIPENAVVVPGSRAVVPGKGHERSREWGLSLYPPVIGK